MALDAPARGILYGMEKIVSFAFILIILTSRPRNARSVSMGLFLIWRLGFVNFALQITLFLKTTNAKLVSHLRTSIQPLPSANAQKKQCLSWTLVSHVIILNTTIKP